MNDDKYPPNAFEALCVLASREGWCWSISCTTCGGHELFRYAFRQIAQGLKPGQTGWEVYSSRTDISRQLMMPEKYYAEERRNILGICLKANLSTIREECIFPDWLGYLGLIVYHMRTARSQQSVLYKKVEQSWAGQLAGMVPNSSQIHRRLVSISDGTGSLELEDLESVEQQNRASRIA